MNRGFNILLIDDDEINLIILSSYLSSMQFNVYCEHSIESAILNIPLHNPDVIIADCHLNSIDGIELCKILRQHHKWYYIIMMTVETDMSVLQLAFKAGANDFIKKPINTTELHGRLINAMYIVNQIYSIKLENDNLSKHNVYLEEHANNLYHQLITDVLTGLYNRRYAEDKLVRLWNNSYRSSIPFSIISIDLDDFKIINDTFGHDVGDIVLKHVANVIKNAVRITDVVCRFGGEEFVIICSDTKPHKLPSLCEKIRVIVQNSQPMLKLEQPITISIGAAMCDKYTDSSWIDTYKRSDIALYKAKNNGKNCVTIYE